MKNLTTLIVLCTGLLCYASPKPKDTIYTNMESLMKEVKSTNKKTATYYLILKEGDDKDVKVRIDLKQIDADIPLYKSGVFDIKKLMALKEENLTEAKEKLEVFDAKAKEWLRLEKEVANLTKEQNALTADSLSLDSTAIAQVEDKLEVKTLEFTKAKSAATNLFDEYEKMMDNLMGSLRTQYKERLVTAMEEAYEKIENKETTFKSVDDDATWFDIQIDLLKIDATREIRIPRRMDGGGETTEMISAGKQYYILHFGEFGSMFEEDKVKKVFSAIKLWEFHLNPYLVDKQFGLVCDDQNRTQHYINSIVDYKNYSGSLEKTEDKPKPGDPLVNMEIASPGASGKKGGTFGCTRNGEHRKCEKGVKYHGGMDIYAVQDTKLYSMYDGTVISLFDKVGRDVYYSSSEKRHRFSDSYVGSLGNDIQIQSEINGKQIVIRYCHLNSISVSVGDNVKQGDIIGLTGRNGNAGKKDGIYASNEPHLHLQIKVNKKTENPNDYLGTKFDNNGLKQN